MTEQGKWTTEWPKCFEKLEKRMDAGFIEYGDGSFERPLSELLDETEEEILDQIVWSFIGWTRIRHLREKVEVLEDRIALMERLRGVVT
jgi:hypothetical protein